MEPIGEDRYHATAIENGAHLSKCMVYIDMNMVRAGVVLHLSEWGWSGYNEIQNPKQRYAIINYNRLTQLLGLRSLAELKETHWKWVDEALKAGNEVRESKWSQSIAVGSRGFVENVKEKLGMKAVHRKTNKIDKGFELRESQAPYSADFDIEREWLSTENSHFWNVYY